MVQLTCPWCEEAFGVEPAAFAAVETVVRCDGCGVETRIGDAAAPVALPLAA